MKKQLTIRIDGGSLERLEKLVERLRSRQRFPLKISRADIVRAVVEDGLLVQEDLERDLPSGKA
jgi:hypothetical protein